MLHSKQLDIRAVCTRLWPKICKPFVVYCSERGKNMKPNQFVDSFERQLVQVLSC
jgi:hypothetical protein